MKEGHANAGPGLSMLNPISDAASPDGYRMTARAHTHATLLDKSSSRCSAENEAGLARDLLGAEPGRR